MTEAWLLERMDAEGVAKFVDKLYMPDAKPSQGGAAAGFSAAEQRQSMSSFMEALKSG